MIYLDASYIARLYLNDSGWQKVRVLAATDHIGCSLHGRAETIAAIHRKFREGALNDKEKNAVFRQFESDCKNAAFDWLPVSPLVVERLRLVFASLPSTVHLRSADALHLACAAENKFSKVYSNDARFLDATKYFGVQGENVI